MSRTNRKRKFEIGLQALFSGSEQAAQPQEPAQAEIPPPEKAVVAAASASSSLLPTKPIDGFSLLPAQPVKDNLGATAASGLEVEAGKPEESADSIEPSETEVKTTMEKESAAEGVEQVVVFTLADEHYAVDIAMVESIIKMQDITEVPNAPLFVEGITNLRGTILPVIDLRSRFEMCRAELTRETRIVVVEANHLLVGLVVDSVTEVLRIPTQAIELPSALVVTAGSAFIRAIAKVGERLVVMLDLGKVLTEYERVELPGLPMIA